MLFSFFFKTRTDKTGSCVCYVVVSLSLKSLELALSVNGKYIDPSGNILSWLVPHDRRTIMISMKVSRNSNNRYRGTLHTGLTTGLTTGFTTCFNTGRTILLTTGQPNASFMIKRWVSRLIPGLSIRLNIFHSITDKINRHLHHHCYLKRTIHHKPLKLQMFPKTFLF